MNRFHTSKWALVAVLFIAQSSVARHQPRHLQPVPADPATIESQLKRFKGQTMFLNPSAYYGMPGPRAAGAGTRGSLNKSADSAALNEPREQQESDVFKVGKPGSKLLYLLNDSRGLQTVSFAAGVASPKLLGRAAATGNYSDQMYYDAARDRLIVLERMYYDSSGNYDWTKVQSRALVYDVKNPEAPMIVQQLDIDGEIADSRMVGDVLYVATSIRPDYTDQSSDQKAKGIVYSIALKGAELKTVKRVELALPASARENMNIVEVQENGAFHYYLLAVLSESGWGWWDRQSMVEVVDISDPKGDVKPVMVVSAKGRINERSQTTIKNNTLIVVSNYQGEEQNAKMNVAVETFKFPTAASEVIDENEALFRKLNIDRQLTGKDADEAAATYAQLIQDAKVGILDRFVRTSTGLRKLIADSIAVIVDSRGLNAGLQDVRFVDDRAYVFWVPQTNVDPFDLFDISQPERGVKHIAHLEFEGWIERSIPVRYQGRNFVLGLGHIVAPNARQEGARYPQAMLFEVVGEGANSRLVQLSQMKLANGNLWTNFNGQDKEIDVHFESQAKGSLMFEVYGMVARNQWVNGGKVIHFDLDAAIRGDVNSVFTEGGLLVADSSWLKRVFNNPEIDRINGFSNESLATFDRDRKAADSVTRAVNILELARNIQAYVDLPTGGKYEQGLQIISKYDGEKAKTELRLVNAARADSEKSEILSSVELEGGYQAHTVEAGGNAIFVASQEYVTEGEGNQRSYKNVTRVYRLAIRHDKVTAAPAQILQEDNNNGYYYGGGSSEFVKLATGETVYRTGSSLYRITTEKATKMALAGCDSETRKLNDVSVVNGQFYVTTTETLADPNREDTEYERNWIAPAQVKDTGVQCGAAINIPGKLLSITRDGHLVTEDSRFVDFRKQTYRSTDREGKPVVRESMSIHTENALESLKLMDGKAQLVDDYLLSDRTNKVQLVGEDRLGYFDSEQVRTYGMPRRYGYYSNEPSTLVSLGFSADLTFTREVFVMPEEFLSGATLTGLIKDGTGDLLGIVTSGRKLQVVRFSGKSTRPQIQSLRALDVRFQKQPAAASILLPQGYWSWSGMTGISYNPVLKTLQIPQNDAGVTQVAIE